MGRARAIDQRLVDEAQEHGPVARYAAEATSTIVRFGIGWLASSIALVRFGSPNGRRAGAQGFLGWCLAEAASFAIKAVADRPRPRQAEIRSSQNSSSMPSSHTAGAVAYAIAAGAAEPRLHAPLLGAAATVAWSRLALGEHFPSDLAAGAAVGTAAGVTVHLTIAKITRRGQAT